MATNIWSFDTKITGTVVIGLIGLLVTFFSWVYGLERKVSVMEAQLNQVMSYQEGRDSRQDEDVERIESIVERLLERK